MDEDDNNVEVYKDMSDFDTFDDTDLIENLMEEC